MQKRDLLIEKTNTATRLFNLIPLFTIVTNYLSRTQLVVALSHFYGFLFDKSFTPLQTIYTLYAQLCLLATLLPCTLNLGWRLLFFTWFCQSFSRSGILEMIKNEP